MKKAVLAAAILSMTVMPLNAFAAQKCYSAAEAEADQGIRIHSELMVIGLNCQVIGKRFLKFSWQPEIFKKNRGVHLPPCIKRLVTCHESIELV